MESIQHQKLWENYYWTLMKSYVYNYPNLPTKSLQKNMYNTFINSGFLIPHDHFRKIFFIYLENISLVNFLDNRKTLMNYLYNLYVYIHKETKKYILNLKSESNVIQDDLRIYIESEEQSFDEFWAEYIKIYTPPPKKLSYEKLLYTQSILYIIILVILVVFIFTIYKYEIRNFAHRVFGYFFI